MYKDPDEEDEDEEEEKEEALKDKMETQTGFDDDIKDTELVGFNEIEDK